MEDRRQEWVKTCDLSHQKDGVALTKIGKMKGGQALRGKIRHLDVCPLFDMQVERVDRSLGIEYWSLEVG